MNANSHFGVHWGVCLLCTQSCLLMSLINEEKLPLKHFESMLITMLHW